jgi:hypothetical protein
MPGSAVKAQPKVRFIKIRKRKTTKLLLGQVLRAGQPYRHQVRGGMHPGLADRPPVKSERLVVTEDITRPNQEVPPT